MAAWGGVHVLRAVGCLQDTGDTRETPAIDVCKGLLKDGARLHIFDPQVPTCAIPHRYKSRMHLKACLCMQGLFSCLSVSKTGSVPSGRHASPVCMFIRLSHL